VLTGGWRVVLLAIGGLAGYGLASGFALERSATPDSTNTNVAPPAATVARETPAAECPTPPATAEKVDAMVDVAPPDAVVPPWDPARDPDRPVDWYRAYSGDVRDRSWAGPAERRIAETVAAAGIRGYYTEYLRCASRFCAIAGFVDPGNGFDSCAVGEGIAEGGVFRGDLRYSCVDQDRGSRRHFIVFIDTAPRS